MFKDLIVYPMEISTFDCYLGEDANPTSYVYVDGKLEIENGFDICAIPKLGSCANNYNGNNEILEDCVVVMRDGKEVQAQIHLMWDGDCYRGLVSDKTDEDSKQAAIRYIANHRKMMMREV